MRCPVSRSTAWQRRPLPDRQPDQWGRSPRLLPRPAPRPLSRHEPWLRHVARGSIFLTGGFCALILSAALAYSGSVPGPFVLAVFSLSPASIVCWALTATKAGDKWTLGYLSAWVIGIVAVTLHDLLVSTF